MPQLKRRKLMQREPNEELPARVVAPPATTEYVNPMELYGHMLCYVVVLHRTGRQMEGHLIFCAKCGAYFWHKAVTLLDRCGAKTGIPGKTLSQ